MVACAVIVYLFCRRVPLYVRQSEDCLGSVQVDTVHFGEHCFTVRCICDVQSAPCTASGVFCCRMYHTYTHIHIFECICCCHSSSVGELALLRGMLELVHRRTAHSYSIDGYHRKSRRNTKPRKPDARNLLLFAEV